MVTGGGRSIGRALVEKLLANGISNVIAIELDAAALDWVEDPPAGTRGFPVIGDASSEAVAEEAADLAQEAGSSPDGPTTPPHSRMPRYTRAGRVRFWTPSPWTWTWTLP